MKINLISDIHIEFIKKEYKVSDFFKEIGDCVVLAGDIGEARGIKYENIIKEFSETFKHVVVILGNHEFYFSEIETIIEKINKLKDIFKNVYFLNNDTVTIEDVTFIGSTLWSDFKSKDSLLLKGKLNDYRFIRTIDNKIHRDLNPFDTKNFYLKNISWLYTEIDKHKNTKNKIIVVTHHAPLSKDISNPRYEKKPHANLGYGTDLTDFIISKNINYWLFGHTHYYTDKKVGNTQIYSNPLGYVGEKTNYRNDFLITI